LDRICTDHERLVDQILEEEEDLISGHREHIDDIVDVVKHEMHLLSEVDKPGSDIEKYVSSLDAILLHKLELITHLRSRLAEFHGHLKLEAGLSKLYQQKGSFIGGDGYSDENLMEMEEVQDFEELPRVNRRFF